MITLYFYQSIFITIIIIANIKKYYHMLAKGFIVFHLHFSLYIIYYILIVCFQSSLNILKIHFPSPTLLLILFHLKLSSYLLTQFIFKNILKVL